MKRSKKKRRLPTIIDITTLIFSLRPERLTAIISTSASPQAETFINVITYVITGWKF